MFTYHKNYDKIILLVNMYPIYIKKGENMKNMLKKFFIFIAIVISGVTIGEFIIFYLKRNNNCSSSNEVTVQSSAYSEVCYE